MRNDNFKMQTIHMKWSDAMCVLWNVQRICFFLHLLLLLLSVYDALVYSLCDIPISIRARSSKPNRFASVCERAWAHLRRFNCPRHLNGRAGNITRISIFGFGFPHLQLQWCDEMFTVIRIGRLNTSTRNRQNCPRQKRWFFASSTK